ncbi:RagB/SusD family nutrient uptake outer membrane protein [Olivibacter sp. SDN3]|uniref:RagB/SusD family nutrient uptake outer membrane protein n=1 Tax=Olivibacter sp. SDN3 TaxID=2764720 RepID=UPI001651A414|nr:RagB/SusD family nutrient uptake outer membrane protein [Olivibacter sp. SDN3]QNL51050.1 RagB/SusD family nutrient uptake outer membrane protein [Olivibacter sp. SDN3]
MKRYFYILLAAFAMPLASCKNALELVPEDQVSGANFFKTTADFTQAINAAYNPLRTVGPDYYTGEMRSDNTHYEFNPAIQGTAVKMRMDIADFTNDASNNYSNQIYYDSYKGISRANIVLARVDQADISEDERSNFKGQALFLRAFYYFKLVRYFGGVPLYLQEVINETDAFLPRSSQEEVYNQIITDATSAIELLAPPTTFPQSGYASKGSATMLLADIYATLKQYDRAETLLLTLEPMGYGLLNNYADVFSTVNKNSRESIFEVQFMQGLETGVQSNFIYIFLPKCYNTALVTYGVPTNNTATEANGGGWNTPTQDIINAYEPGDTRLEASIGIAEGNYDGSYYFTLSAQRSIVNYQAPEGKTGVPFIKKYLNPHTDVLNTDDNWPVYRFADALLLLAEAQNEQGKMQEALANLNRVRSRAMPRISPLATNGQEDLRELILHERRVELAFENHRWFDLIRAGEIIGVMNAYGTKLKETHTYLLPGSYQVDEAKLLYPLPFAEVGVNPELIQNPGY